MKDKLVAIFPQTKELGIYHTYSRYFQQHTRKTIRMAMTANLQPNEVYRFGNKDSIVM